MSGDDLAALLYLATSHPDDFIRCACAARALELRDLPVTAASVARTAQVDDRALAGDVADRLGVAQPARLYDLRSTFASNSLAAGVTVFELARLMGTSATMIERHYGTLVEGAGPDIARRLSAFETAQERAADAVD